MPRQLPHSDPLRSVSFLESSRSVSEEQAFGCVANFVFAERFTAAYMKAAQHRHQRRRVSTLKLPCPIFSLAFAMETSTAGSSTDATSTT
jgi:hypothetical protein